ncbi:MAG: hypothetical protein VZR09_04690 [Candidatus Gastranaerophilaceae bacterium]|nr:hypothetical protein [Candidatus Gastranaerophilaceae bacterium]
MNNTLDLGLQFITLDNMFVFKTNDFELDEEGMLIFYNSEESKFFEDFFTTFSVNVLLESDNVHRIQMESYVKYSSFKKQLENFLNQYKEKYKRLNALEKAFKNINEGETICILPAWLNIDTDTYLAIREELCKYNGKENNGLRAFLKTVTDNYNINHYEGNNRINIGEKDKKKRECRWCHRTIKSKPCATFNEDAHAISEGLGNKNLILFEECDECNHKFAASIETDIINQLKLLNTFWGVIGKNGIPKIKFEGTIIENKGNQKIEINSNQIEFKDNVPVAVHYNGDSIVLQNIYKALCKFALGLVKDKELLKLYKWTIDWINGNEEVTKLPVVKELFTYKFFPKYPVLQLYIRKNDNKNVPQMFAIFYHTNIVYLYISPQNRAELEKFNKEESYNNFIETLPYQDVNWKNVDLSDNTRRSTSMTLNFKKRYNKKQQ